MILKLSKNVAAVAGVFTLTMVCVPQTHASQIIVKEFTVEKSSVPWGSGQGGPQTKPTAKVIFKGEYSWSSTVMGYFSVSYGYYAANVSAQGSVMGPQGQSPALPAVLSSSNNTFYRTFDIDAYSYSTSLSTVGQPISKSGYATLAP
jgi:hypothetical protein